MIEGPFKEGPDKSYILSLFLVLPKKGHTLAQFDLTRAYGATIRTIFLYKAVFEVDDHCGTGSAATGVVISRTCWHESKEISVIRPFMILVTDITNGLILFA